MCYIKSFLYLTCISVASAFLPYSRYVTSQTSTSFLVSRTFHYGVSSSNVNEIKEEIKNMVTPTKRGLRANNDDRLKIDNLLKQLESNCIQEPARSPFMEGKWLVEYSTAPPPSNGKLGPFEGNAKQIINLEDKTYVNLLTVDPDAWLSAELKAKWEEWDGVIIGEDEEDNNQSAYDDPLEQDLSEDQENPTNIFETLSRIFSQNKSVFDDTSKSAKDYGASSWKVTFDSLQIKVFGVPLVRKEFENTSRVWKMTYVDDETRIVRAGRTGRSEDDVVFYMSRDN